MPDSRSPRSLVVNIVPKPDSGTARAEEPPTLSVSVTNCKETVWLASTPDGMGIVSLGVRLFTVKRELVLDKYAFVRLPRDLHPNETLSMCIQLPAIMVPGDYLVEFDMEMIWAAPSP